MPYLRKQLDVDKCPQCQVRNPNLSIHTGVVTKGELLLLERHWKVYICNSCGGLVTAWSSTEEGETVEIFPTAKEIDTSIPDVAREYLRQAEYSRHSPAGAVMLCASSVDAMLKKKKYTKGWLRDRIDKAAADYLITNAMAEWAHDVRLDANDPRHADEKDPLPTPDRAEKCIEFTRALAEFLFVLPARIEKGRKKPAEPDSQNQQEQPGK